MMTLARQAFTAIEPNDIVEIEWDAVPGTYDWQSRVAAHKLLVVHKALHVTRSYGICTYKDT